MRYFYYLLLLVLPFGSHAQDWFSENQPGDMVAGYIITVTGDTLHGKIKYDYPLVMQKRVSFTTRDNEDPITYQPNDIRGYAISGNKWSSLSVVFNTYNGPYQFNRFGLFDMGDGPLQLFRLFGEKDKVKKNISSARAETIYSGITVKRNEASFRDLYLKKSENQAIDINQSEFKKNFAARMSGLAEDYPELREKILNKNYSFRDLPVIVKEYNAWYQDKIYNKAR